MLVAETITKDSLNFEDKFGILTSRVRVPFVVVALVVLVIY